MIRYSKYHAWFCLFLVLLMTFVQPFAVFADVMTPSNAFAVIPDCLIGSASNADPYGIATMELTDEDYYIQPFSTLGTVTNTVMSNVVVSFSYFDTSIESYRSASVTPSYSGGRWRFNYNFPSGCYLGQLRFRINAGGFPSPGTYNFSFDFTSDFAYDYESDGTLTFVTYPKNADYTRVNLKPSTSTFSGDIYVSPFTLNLTNFSGRSYMEYYLDADLSAYVNQIGGSFAIHFEKVANNSSAPSTGPDYSSADYESDVSGSLSDISSSIGDMSSSMDSAAENLEYISTSQNLIIQGIDNVIMHISDQLYAFWDQLYNLIHEPTYARLGDILDAIRNLDLEITVEMTEVTNAVNKMNQDMQNKLQHTTDKITGGYDSSVLESENQQIQSAVDEYDQSEQAILDSVEGNIEVFTYPSFDDLPLGTLGALGFFGGLMQSIFECMGAFNMIITFSLTLVFVLILIGYHRIRN